MTTLDPAFLLVVASIFGAGLNVIRGASNSSEPFSFKKFGGALVAAIVAGIAAIQILEPTSLGGPIQVFIVGLLAGFGADFTLSRLNK
jgi:drug/metabolite transporter (DMT)-like permease